MDAQDAVTLVALSSSVLVLGYASALDWRTRRVANRFWIALSAVAVALLVARVFVDDAPLEYLLVLIPVLAVLADVYNPSDGTGRMAWLPPVASYGVAIVSVVLLVYAWSGEEYFLHLMAVPFMMLLVVLMYMLDIVRGGADAKALIALTIMFPFYPRLGSFPVVEAQTSYAEVFFPFSFVILVHAAIIVALTPLAFATRNLASGEFRFPLALFGYRLDAETAKSKHVWLMERIEGETHRTYSRPRSDEDLAAEIDKLTASGRDRVWVTPKVPFIIPMAISLVFTTVVGNLLVILMGI